MVWDPRPWSFSDSLAYGLLRHKFGRVNRNSGHCYWGAWYFLWYTQPIQVPESAQLLKRYEAYSIVRIVRWHHGHRVASARHLLDHQLQCPLLHCGLEIQYVCTENIYTNKKVMVAGSNNPNKVGSYLVFTSGFLDLRLEDNIFCTSFVLRHRLSFSDLHSGGLGLTGWLAAMLLMGREGTNLEQKVYQGFRECLFW